MTFSVGVLYSVHEFLEFANGTRLTAEEFAKERRFALTKPDLILEVSQNCNWIHLTVQGEIKLTPRGERIVKAATAPLRLRLQIEDLIEFHNPPWATKIRHGRKEAAVGMPNDVIQCFEESGLMEAWNDDLIVWWDASSLLARSRHSEKLSKTGRTAERWTCEFEEKRTGSSPQHVCLDSNFAGYDVLSQVSGGDASPLPIEVKGSERRPKEADFVFTRNEYEAAKSSSGYRIHLWFVSEHRQLFDVPFAEVEKHLPTDQLEGRWETARIPFSPFIDFRAA
jgi:hypothetical protein